MNNWLPPFLPTPTGICLSTSYCHSYYIPSAAWEKIIISSRFCLLTAKIKSHFHRSTSNDFEKYILLLSCKREILWTRICHHVASVLGERRLKQLGSNCETKQRWSKMNHHPRLCCQTNIPAYGLCVMQYCWLAAGHLTVSCFQNGVRGQNQAPPTPQYINY